ncbi:MAG: hypothetical protein WC662_03850 [Candidatus Paceibacterota bacterium]|jgi:chromosome segregation ATPase
METIGNNDKYFNKKTGKDEKKENYTDHKKILKAIEGLHASNNTIEIYKKEKKFMNDSSGDTLSKIKKLEQEIKDLKNKIQKNDTGFEEYKSNYDMREQPPKIDYLIDKIKRKKAEIEKLIQSN